MSMIGRVRKASSEQIAVGVDVRETDLFAVHPERLRLLDEQADCLVEPM